MTKKSTPSIVTKIFVPVASAAIISLGSFLYQGYNGYEELKNETRNYKRALDSFIVVTNNWVAHLDEEMSEQQKLTQGQDNNH